MKPGARTSPAASISRFAAPAGTIFPPATAISSRLAGAPVPSTTVAFRIRMSHDIAKIVAAMPFDFDALYRAESRRVFATLVRLLGDFDLAEEALAEAFRAALEQWPREGVPANPRAWLVSAGRFKAIDAIRRQGRFDPLGEDAENIAGSDDSASWASEDIEDDR